MGERPPPCPPPPPMAMGMGFPWEFHGKCPMGWNGTGMNCYGMGGMRQNIMPHGQARIFVLEVIFVCNEDYFWF